MLGKEHPDTLRGISNLAELYRAQSRYHEAEPLFKRALAVSERVLGEEHPDTLTSVNNLARLYQAQGRHGEAELLYKRALAARERVRGPEHPGTIASINDLARLYQAQGRRGEAEPLFMRALAANERLLGKEHPDTLTSANNLASLYADQGRYSEAEPLFMRVLAASERVLGKEHPHTLASVNNLASLYQDQGRYGEAEPLLKRALEGAERTLGKEHPNTLTSVNNLAQLYQAEGRYREAVLLFKRALEARERVLGNEHPDTLKSINGLASLSAKGRDGKAEELLKRAYAARARALGPEHPDTLASVNDLALLYSSQSRYGEAEPLFKQAVDTYERVLGKEHPDTLRSVNNLALLYRTQGRYGEAESQYRRALAANERVLGPEHPDTLVNLANLAGLYYAQRDWTRAAQIWRRSTAAIASRTRRGALDIGQSVTGKRKSYAEQWDWQFWGLVKAVHRLAPEGRGPDAAASREMFQTAQWALSSEAAQSLAQMAARGAKGDPKLAALTRERQNLVAEWQMLDAWRSAALGREMGQRDAKAEAENAARLAAIDARIAEIDRRLAAEFPDYAALANPAPLAVEEVQAQLGGDEALVLFLDTPKWEPTPEEMFIWVVTKTDMRWVRSDLGGEALTREIQALRCGLDQAAWTASRCSMLLGRNPEIAPTDQLPFDLAGAHRLYKALFGKVEDLIKGKQLLIVPSGPLTQIPFQVLVQEEVGGANATPVSRGWLGIPVVDISSDSDLAKEIGSPAGVLVGQPLHDGPGEKAGLQVGDAIVAVDGLAVKNAIHFIATIQATLPGTEMELKLVRDKIVRVVKTKLGKRDAVATLFFNPAEHKHIGWLTRDHATSVLPAASSLKALRATGHPSAAANPLIGFGNPLLMGPGKEFAEYAKLAREKQSCAKAEGERIAALPSDNRGITPIDTRSGLARPKDIRAQPPLPETADELCAVARDVGADVNEIRLGDRATEHEVKAISESGELAQYRIVHFATHGAMAGELKQGFEPGLILTPPAEASDDDDGYLSAFEIAALKLDADWVILSACNTAAGNASNAEALSGLARAFIYAQARALLVSHWAVDSNATVKLITTAMREIARDKNVGRAEALRRAMLAMIDGSDPKQAQPAYWAPFVVIGEGAR